MIYLTLIITMGAVALLRWGILKRRTKMFETFLYTFIATIIGFVATYMLQHDQREFNDALVIVIITTPILLRLPGYKYFKAESTLGQKLSGLKWEILYLFTIIVGLVISLVRVEVDGGFMMNCFVIMFVLLILPVLTGLILKLFKKTMGPVLFALFYFLIFIWFITRWNYLEQKNDLDKEKILIEAVVRANFGCPKRMDDITIMDSCDVKSDFNFIVYYTVTSSVNKSGMLKEVKQGMIAKLKSNTDETIQSLKKIGVKFLHIYRDTTGKTIGTIQISSTDYR